jgi:hypothetical protein
MDALNAFETLAQKVELILEKYEAVLKDKEAIERRMSAHAHEREQLIAKIEEFSSERVAVMQRIDAMLTKIEELGI